MLKKPRPVLHHVVTSLKVAALITVLGTVVLAAERHLARQASPEQIIATDAAPAGPVSPAISPKTSAPQAQPAPDDYFPSHFDESKGETSEQPSTF
jgi:hypothetical protein